MKVRFSINYFTHFGQKLFISGSADELGDNNESKAIEMQYIDGSEWSIELDITTIGNITYKYFVKHEESIVAAENDFAHTTQLTKAENCIVYNTWKNPTCDNFLRTSAFKDCFLAHTSTKIVYITTIQS